MKLHFCEACGKQFQVDGELPDGPAMCDGCRQKKGLPPAAQAKRSNTALRSVGRSGAAIRASRSNNALRASGTRVGHRVRFGGGAGSSTSILWVGILGLLVLAGVLTFILLRYTGTSEEQPPQRPPQPPSTIIQS